MDKQFLKDAFGWGAGLWFIGYVLGMIAFMTVSTSMIGWVVSPIGTLIALWVLFRKVNPPKDQVGKLEMAYYLKIAIVWTIIAIVFDYLFLVLVFKPANGYYKLDVYFYYITTFALPLLIGVFKTSNFKKIGLPDLIQRQAKEKKEHKQKILNMLDLQVQITNNDIEKLLGVSDKTVQRYFNELQSEGKIKQVGETGRSVFYTKA